MDSDFDSVDEVDLIGAAGVVVILGVDLGCVAFRATASCGKRVRSVGDSLNRTILLNFDCLFDREIDVGVETFDRELGGAMVKS